MKRRITPAIYLLAISIIYLLAGSFNLLVARFAPIEAIQVAYLIAIAAPVAVPPLGRFVGIRRKTRHD